MSAIPLRPLHLGEILDGAFGLFRRDYRLYMPVALVGLLPSSVAFAIPTSGDADPLAMLSDPGAGLLFFGLMAVGLLFSLMAWAALASAMDARIGGRPASVGRCYARALALFPKLAGAAILAGLLLLAVLVVATFLVAIPAAVIGELNSIALATIGLAIVVITMLAAAAVWITHTYLLVPVAVVEGRGPFATLRRSFGLVRGNRLRVLLVAAVAWFITMMPGLAAAYVVGGAGWFLESNPAQTMGLVRYWLLQLVSLGLGCVTAPLWVASAMVLFADLKARGEGADLEAAARAMAD